MQTCATITVPPNAVLAPAGADPLLEAATLTITCNNGYAAVGNVSSTCTSGSLTPDISGTTCGEYMNTRFTF